ncbi:fluoride efflux transporter CrcB [Verrucomicrobiota bacterium]
MKNILLVGIGGFIGAALRYKIGGLILHQTVNWKFPAGTFLVNVCGCLAAGILMALAVKQDFFSPNTRLVLFTGILGGFTTFSAFGIETVYLLEQHEIFWAGLYVVLTVSVGILALWLGTSIIR